MPFCRRIWVTIHDTPTVCGGAFFFTTLDRRGGRRIASWLSRRLGLKAERTALQRVERVYCLSAVGAHLLSQRLSLTRPVLPLPFCCGRDRTSLSTRRSILLPGYLDGAQNVAPVLSDSRLWRRRAGAWRSAPVSASTKVDIQALARQMGIAEPREWLDYLSERQDWMQLSSELPSLLGRPGVRVAEKRGEVTGAVGTGVDECTGAWMRRNNRCPARMRTA